MGVLRESCEIGLFEPQIIEQPEVLHVTNEQRLILVNAEQVLTEFCLNFQIKGGSCKVCPLYFEPAGRCALGVVSEAKRIIRCHQPTTQEGE